PVPLSKDSYGNAVIFIMLYGGKKDMLHLTSMCPVDTSLTLIQSVFTWQEIYNQAVAFVSADPNLRTYLLLQVFDLMKQKKWAEAKFLWIGNLPLYANLTKTDQIDLFGGLFEWFFKQFFGDSLDQNLIVVKTAPLILVINVTGISFTDKEIYFENKDLPEEIDFPSNGINIKQRYRLMEVSFCDGNHHIVDVHFENVKNAGKENKKKQDIGNEYLTDQLRIL
ncbi:17022_t:CDS:2, partial [Gigaspora rosea]